MSGYHDLEKRVFLMLIPEHPTYERAKHFQEEVNQKYHLYQILPTLHITLESIFVEDDADIGRVTWAIQEICQKAKSFPIMVDGFACFGPPYKSVQLHVIKTEPLMQLYRMVHSRLKEIGFKVKEYPEGIKFHMTIASPCFAEREWSEDEYNKACVELKSLSFFSGFVLKKLELWCPTVDESKKVLANFTLKEY